MAVAEIRLGIGLVDASRERLFVIPHHPDVLPLLANDDRGSGVLARRKNHARGNIRVLHEFERDEAVVVRGFGILENLGKLR